MTDQKKLNIAVLGLGIGRMHLGFLAKNPRANVVTLCDLRRDHAENVAKEFNVPRITTELKEVIADPDVDAIIVALPVHLHAPVTLAALAAGKHVLCEKPMAPTVAEGQAMLEAAKSRKLVLTFNHNQRFDPTTVFAARQVAEGRLGKIHFARGVWSRPSGSLPGTDRNWFNEKDKGGGVLFDLGTHLLDRVLSMVGFPEPVEFAATSFTVLGKEQERRTGCRYDADDLSVGMVRFANGLTMQLEVGFASHIEREAFYIELYGEKGGITTRDGFKFTSIIDGTAFTSYPPSGLPQPPVPSVTDDFVGAVLDQRAPVVTPESALHITRVLDGLRTAAARGWGRPS